MIATLKFPSDRLNFLLVGNENSRRVELFQRALSKQGLRPARLMTYRSLLAGTIDIETMIYPDTIVRIESPGRDFEVQRDILHTGAAVACENGAAFMPADEIESLQFRKGEILCPAQWYAGYCALLDKLSQQLFGRQDLRFMNSIEDIKVMFDKSLCHSRMKSAGIAVPRALESVACYEDLIDKVRQHQMNQVFVKLRHSSSGSGVVALRFGKAGAIAITTTEIQRELDGKTRFYNSRKIRRYEDHQDIRMLVDFLCAHGVHVEEWIPKDTIAGKPYDLRILSIAGTSAHSIARLGNSPITNLHLLNDRMDSVSVLQRVPQLTLQKLESDVRSAAKLFDGSLHVGLDVLITRNRRKHVVLEANAFGDLLPDVLHNGVDSYTAEIMALPSDPNKSICNRRQAVNA